MQVSVHNTVKVYNLTAGKSLPEWLSERKKNKKEAGGEHRIELINEFEFPDFARCIFRTQNGTHLFAAGDYPPRIRCFDVNQMSMKFSFNADMPILGGVSLSPDYRKFALRGENRMLTIHNTAHVIDRVRVPSIMRGMEYHPYAAELLCPSVTPEIYRLNLETGAFQEPFVTNSENGVNHVDVFEPHGLTLAGCVNGVVEAWDARQGKAAGVVTVLGKGDNAGVPGSEGEVTHVCADKGGLLFTCGTNNGEVVLYDIRLNRPVLVKDHMNGLKIVKTYFFQGKSASTGESTHILSADTRSLKVWNRNDGTNFTTLEPPASINDFTVLRANHNMVAPYESDDSGVICLACDTPRVQVQFIPQLGVAPRWAAFLDTITEELEEKEATTVYDDYRFVTQQEMDSLGLKPSDIEDGRVRPAMHGCFVENAFYRELKAVVDPQGFNRQVQENAKDRRKKKSEDRISKFKRVEKAEGADGEDADLAKIAASDTRFAKALQSDAFALDRKNPEYLKLLNKIEAKQKKASDRSKKYQEEQFRIVPAGDDDEADEDAAGSSDDERQLARRELHGKNLQRPKLRDEAPAKQQQKPVSGGDKNKKNVALYESKEGMNFALSDRQTHAVRKRERHKTLSLQDRMMKAKQQK